MFRYLTTVVAIIASCSLLANGIANKNEIGVLYDTAYLSDLETFWNSGSIYYTRTFDWGALGGRVNRMGKFDDTANQYQVRAIPKILDVAYLDLSYGISGNHQIVYPSQQYSAELFVNQQNMEISIGQGGMFFAMFSDQKIFSYTASCGLYYDNYFAWARLNLYSIQGVTLTALNLRRYFTNRYSYVSIGANIGRIPDIGDLPPLDEILIMHQSAIYISGQFNIHKSLYLNCYLNYAHQVYPNNHIRNYTEGAIGLLWVF